MSYPPSNREGLVCSFSSHGRDRVVLSASQKRCWGRERLYLLAASVGTTTALVAAVAAAVETTATAHSMTILPVATVVQAW